MAAGVVGPRSSWEERTGRSARRASLLKAGPSGLGDPELKLRLVMRTPLGSSRTSGFSLCHALDQFVGHGGFVGLRVHFPAELREEGVLVLPHDRQILR